MKRLVMLAAAIGLLWARLAHARQVKILVDVTRKPTFQLGDKSFVRPTFKKITDLNPFVAGDDCWDGFVSGETFTGRKAVTVKKTWPFRKRLKKVHSNDAAWKPWPLGNGLKDLVEQPNSPCVKDGRTLRKYLGNTVVP